MNVGFFTNLWDTVEPFLRPILNFAESTALPRQFSEVDVAGVFSNPWFLVPFICLVGYLIYKKSINDLVIIGMMIGVWYFTGTEYAHSLVIDGIIQPQKIVPVMFGGVAAISVLIYLIFIKSD